MDEKIEERLEQGALILFGAGLGEDLITADGLRRILLKLSSPRERRPRKCRRYTGIHKLLSKLPPAVPVHKLSLLFNEKIGDEGTKHLHLLPSTIVDLDLTRCGISEVGFKNVFTMIKTNDTIARLVLWGCSQAGDEGAECVRNALKVNRTLRSLNIRHSRFSPVGFAHVSDGLAHNDTLEKISLGYWSDTSIVSENTHDEHIGSLCGPGLAVNKALKRLLVYGDFTDEGYGHVARVLERNTALIEVQLMKNGSRSPPANSPSYEKMCFYLMLNRLNRKIVYDEHATLSDYRDAIIASTEADSLSAIFWFVRNKPDICIGARVLS